MSKLEEKQPEKNNLEVINIKEPIKLNAFAKKFTPYTLPSGKLNIDFIELNQYKKSPKAQFLKYRDKQFSYEVNVETNTGTLNRHTIEITHLENCFTQKVMDVYTTGASIDKRPVHDHKLWQKLNTQAHRLKSEFTIGYTLNVRNEQEGILTLTTCGNVHKGSKKILYGGSGDYTLKIDPDSLLVRQSESFPLFNKGYFFEKQLRVKDAGFQSKSVWFPDNHDVSVWLIDGSPIGYIGLNLPEDIKFSELLAKDRMRSLQTDNFAKVEYVEPFLLDREYQGLHTARSSNLIVMNKMNNMAYVNVMPHGDHRIYQFQFPISKKIGSLLEEKLSKNLIIIKSEDNSMLNQLNIELKQDKAVNTVIATQDKAINAIVATCDRATETETTEEKKEEVTEKTATELPAVETINSIIARENLQSIKQKTAKMEEKIKAVKTYLSDLEKDLSEVNRKVETIENAVMPTNEENSLLGNDWWGEFDSNFL